MNRFLMIFGFLFCALTVNANAQNLELPDSLKGFKRVPVVGYRPLYGFNLAINDAFRFTETQDYYLISRDQVYSHDTKYEFHYYGRGHRDRKLYLNQNPVNIDKFVDIIMENDSCFFIYFAFLKTFNNQFLGIMSEGNLTILDFNGRKFDSFEELAISVSSDNSLESFYNDYIELTQSILYFRSGFYNVKSKEEAIAQLRSDYNFKNLNTLDEMEMIDNFVEQLQQIIPPPEGKIDNLVASLKLALNESQERPYQKQFILSKLGSTNVDFIPLKDIDVSDVLKRYYSPDEYKILSEKLAINRAGSNVAYQYLSYWVKKYLMEKHERVIGYPSGTIKYVLPVLFGDEGALDRAILSVKK